MDINVASAAESFPSVSLILPTRERGEYLKHSIRTCLRTTIDDIEILVLDNASTDNTRDIVESIDDQRVKYHRSDIRLSMRNNFERGLDFARGKVISFIGDDDAILADSVARVLELMNNDSVKAVSCSRAHYAWPDLNNNRRNIALIPRGDRVDILDSREQLAGVLRNENYYNLPILYHGFVARDLVEKIRSRQGRFFLSSQPDIYSAIALSMEGICYAFSEAPLVINGGSGRSNGASHYGGADNAEKLLWQKEDDVGFLPGFEAPLTLGAPIVESALRYCAANGGNIGDMFDPVTVSSALETEAFRRCQGGRDAAESVTMAATAGIAIADGAGKPKYRTRAMNLMRSFLRTMPVNMAAEGVSDIDAAAIAIGDIIARRRTGISIDPLGQLAAAMRLARPG